MERKAKAHKRVKLIRKRLIFKGIIQGVGFRPSVYRCAVSLGLSGYVQNRKSEVAAEIEGPSEIVNSFLEEFEKFIPSAARIDAIHSEDIPTLNEPNFRIIQSLSDSYDFPPIPPDLAICSDCRRELFDPGNRRYLYPFITCTQCGPRYSIVEDTPFDRDTTSMIDFPQCEDCMEEYTNPLDRRFHSQTNSCSECGPKLMLCKITGEEIAGDPLLKTIAALKKGKIVAIQGIGGFHLAANPAFPETVKKLRFDKERKRKPFALMVKDIETIEKLVYLEEEDRRILDSPASPIMILQKRDRIPEELSLVSDMETLGVFLPYTPLHLLLFFHPEDCKNYDYLIMTSGNIKDEPIITNPGSAMTKLRGIADLILYNNRRILFRTDDSIVRRGRTSGTFIMRRSRGYVPGLFHIKERSDDVVLAVGGDLKNAPSLLKGNDIYLAPYIGDLSNPVTMDDFEKQVNKILSLYEVKPDRIVYDMHPGYFSSRWALEWAEKMNIPATSSVQHHHAHILSVMAEHNLNEVLGLSFDGTGYGTDGTVWGGEFLLCSRSHFERLGHFATFILPGGEAAIVNPLRIAISILLPLLGKDDTFKLFSGISDLKGESLEILLSIIEKRVNSPVTSSLGRIFDAASAALGLVDTVTYEGEGPIKLENRALNRFTTYSGHSYGARNKKYDIPPYKLQYENDKSEFAIDMSETILYLLEKRDRIAKGDLAFQFHLAVTRATIEGVLRMKEKTGLNRIALSGGVFQNLILRELIREELESNNFEIFFNVNIPPGDGGISVGQAYFKGT